MLLFFKVSKSLLISFDPVIARLNWAIQNKRTLLGVSSILGLGGMEGEPDNGKYWDRI